MQKGVTIWLTGLSGSGKTTISRLVEYRVKQHGFKAELLDGDEVRRNLTTHLDFSKEDRQNNNKIVTYVAKLLSRNNIIVLTSLISPYQELRDYARKEITNFIEVYVKCPLEECINRDVKGLYKKALNGEISSFTGISDPFEEPKYPEIIVETNNETAEESAEKIIKYLIDFRYL